jgi:hypothetical protein
MFEPTQVLVARNIRVLLKEEITQMISKVQERIKETRGVYNFELIRESAKRGDSDLDQADYISNSVVLKSTKNMGRGLFASKNIKTGSY